MEVVIPAPEFHFIGLTDTAYVSAPSTPPRHFGGDSYLDISQQFNSAPTSPTAAAAIYAAFRNNCSAAGNASSVPFAWEENPKAPKSRGGNTDERDDADFDFAFQIGGRRLGKGTPPAPPPLTDADELFELGIIRPLKLPPRLYTPVMGDRSPKSFRNRGGLLSPLRSGLGRCGKEVDPFTVAMVEVTSDRGRETNTMSRKGSRSLSPFRGKGGRGFFHTPNSSPPPPSVSNVSCKDKGSIGGGRKWFLKNLPLFRNSRDGSKDRLCSYTSSSSSSYSSLPSPKKNKGLSGKNSESSSFRWDSGSGRRGAVTPHEMGDATELAVATADEPTTKTPLLQRQSLFKFLRIKAANRAVAVSRFGVYLFNRGRR
ncbi:hypothetical protein HPP92_010693 [Vanilla planifolia]|uniref:Uncharacterized protein n=1 Tax=Vanilla planifolia TaxID=51239 RepID=A0A835R5L8_VANPL|nr:hypothetical protein HPP92_010693 [Vanilla planifolia]